MIQHIHSLKYEVTDTELEALIEECRLIREIRPKYNKLMKNHRNYVYIKIAAEPYPKILQINEEADDGAYYFGPFTSPHRVETMIEFLNAFYPTRKCTSPGLVKRANGCLFFQLGTCLGVCTGRINPDKYRNIIERIRQLLNGNDRVPVQELANRLDEAVEKLEFEKAAQYKEYYLALQYVISKQKLVQSSSKKRNILAIEFLDSFRVKLFFIKGNKLLYRTVIHKEKTESSVLKEYLMQTIRDQFFEEKKVNSRLTQQDIDEAQIIFSYLKKNKNNIMSFWIPSTYLNQETSRLEIRVDQILNQIIST